VLERSRRHRRWETRALAGAKRLKAPRKSGHDRIDTALEQVTSILDWNRVETEP
jgi:hypothetical protein